MEKCFLCKSKERDDIKYGEFMTRGSLSVHYFCLLLTSNLLQRGRDDQGFLGFLVTDIKNEAIRVATDVCCYCKKKSANITCCAKKCRKTFHMTCGRNNDAENQFVGTFKSYCDRHVTGKKPHRLPLSSDTCCICYEDILGQRGKFNCVTMLQAPCCKNGWFHKWCLAAFAKTAGYFFKCPLCNDTKVFRSRLVYKGIFIPDRDAAWELEPNAFAELLERPKECSAITCNAKRGRTESSSQNELLLCATCGSVAVHRNCMTPTSDSSFYCERCISVVAPTNNTSIVNISANQQSGSSEEEDSDVNVCEEDDDDLSETDDSDADEGTVQPIGRINKKSIRIYDDDETSDDDTSGDDTSDDETSDDETSDDEDGVIEDTIIVVRRNPRLMSLDIQAALEPMDGRETRPTSRDTESLFDSGAESDRSGSSADKSNTNLLEAKTLGGNSSETSQKKEKYDDDLLRRIKRFNEANKGFRQIISFNEPDKMNPSESKKIFIIASMSADIKLEKKEEKPSEIYVTKTEANEDVKFYIDVKIPREDKTRFEREVHKDNDPLEKSFAEHGTRRGSLNTNTTDGRMSKYLRAHSRTQSEDPSKLSPAVERVRRRSFLQSQYRTPSLQEIPRTKSIEELKPAASKRRASLNTNTTDGHIPRYLRTRSRTNSEDPSESSPSVQRVRRRSFLQSQYGTPSLQEIPSTKSIEELKPIASKRSRNNSMSSSNDTTQIKRHRNNSTSIENENNYHEIDTRQERHSSRGRSPLSANLCSLNAYLTPSYVKRNDPPKEVPDTPSVAGISLPTEPIVPEVGQVFSKNKSNIPLSKNVDVATSTVITESNSMSTSNNKQIRTAQEKLLQNYNWPIHNSAKSKLYKPKNKRISQAFTNLNLPCNQTRIESFFKRI